MNTLIKQIEDMSLNAWPSHKMELYDGWILRFSYFYTHRTNSVEQFGVSSLPWREKIPFCEEEYQRLGSPAIFKISPLVSLDFDYMLENRGYQIEHVTNVCILSLDSSQKELQPRDVPASAAASEGTVPCDIYRTVPTPDVELSDSISPEWIESLFSLKKMTNPIHRRVVPSMYQAIPKETISACVRRNGSVIATGLGILDRDYIGIYAIHVREDFRGKGLARQVCSCLLKEGHKRGAANAYLQVVKDNTPAENLYASIGFRKLYDYWFRVQSPAQTV